MFRSGHMSIAVAALAVALSSAAVAADLGAREPEPTPPAPAPEVRAAPTLRVGAYFGALSPQALRNITVLRPWATTLRQDYLFDMHAVYTVYRFDSIPLDVEIEGGVAKRFGTAEGGSAWEFDLAPVVRWKSWPWNDYIYTNFRLALVGASYVTKVSAFERDFDAHGHGSRFLNWLVPEFTFAPNANSPFEVFVRVHHRSGAGVIGNTRGGSNYVAAGVRVVAY
jgi:hypothetical protein